MSRHEKRPRRVPPNGRQILAAAIAQIFNIPREHLKLMTVDQIISLIQTDHDPVLVAVAQDLGWTPDQYNHPSNLTLRLIPDHGWKTATKDIPDLRKSDRIEDKHREFQSRILAKGQEEPPPRKTSRIPSRPFQKAPDGAKFDFKTRRWSKPQ